MGDTDTTSQQRRVTDLMLERYLADDLTAEQRAWVDEQRAASEGVQERLAALEASRTAFYAADPPDAFAHRVAVRLSVEGEAHAPKRRWWLWISGPSLAAAAAFVLAVSVTQVAEDEGPLAVDDVAEQMAPAGAAAPEETMPEPAAAAEEEPEAADLPARGGAAAPTDEERTARDARGARASKGRRLAKPSRRAAPKKKRRPAATARPEAPAPEASRRQRKPKTSPAGPEYETAPKPPPKPLPVLEGAPKGDVGQSAGAWGTLGLRSGEDDDAGAAAGAGSASSKDEAPVAEAMPMEEAESVAMEDAEVSRARESRAAPSAARAEKKAAAPAVTAVVEVRRGVSWQAVNARNPLSADDEVRVRLSLSRRTHVGVAVQLPGGRRILALAGSGGRSRLMEPGTVVSSRIDLGRGGAGGVRLYVLSHTSEFQIRWPSSRGQPARLQHNGTQTVIDLRVEAPPSYDAGPVAPSSPASEPE